MLSFRLPLLLCSLAVVVIGKGRDSSFPSGEERELLETTWKNEHDVVHVLQTKFMQHQSSLVDLGEARLDMMKTVTIPSLREQSSNEFLWVIWTTPKLDEDLKQELIAELQGMDNVVLAGYPGRITNDFRSFDIAQLMEDHVWYGSYQHLVDYHDASQTRLLLDTRLDGNDALAKSFVATLQTQAMEEYQFADSDAWGVMCPRKSFEWRYYDDTRDEHLMCTGRLVDLEHKRFCINTGLTVVYNSDADIDDLPTKEQCNMHKEMPLCSEEAVDPNKKGCISKIEMDGDYAVFRPRTAADAGMKHVYPNHEHPATTHCGTQEECWALAESQFPFTGVGIQLMRTRLENNMEAILMDAIEGQCTTGHSCSEKSMGDLKKLLDEFVYVPSQCLFLPTNLLATAPPTAEFECPEPDSEPISLPTAAGDILQSFKLSKPNVLCMLLSIDSTGRKAVARSYNGEDWEKYNGDFADIDVTCTENSCNMVLPHAGVGGIYQLSSTLCTPGSSLDEFSRFLEQATFGATYKDIMALNDLVRPMNRKLRGTISMGDDSGVPVGETPTLVMANWIKHQQDAVHPTFHRQVFRKHANARYEAASQSGQVSHPCETNTYYRRIAFTDKDSKKSMTLSTEFGTRLVRVGGEIRTTVLSIQFKDGDQMVSLVDGTYAICENAVPKLGGYFGVSGPSTGNRCTPVYVNGLYGNPLIQLDPAVHGLVTMMNLEGHLINTNTFAHEKDLVMMLSSDIENATCESIVMGNGDAPTIFARNGESSEMWMYDPRFVLLSNTESSPLADGGGALKEATEGPISKASTKCASVPRTPFNEGSCFISTEVSACGTLKVPSIPVPLNAESIRSFYVGTERQKYVYAVDGLNVQADNTAPYPCSASARSRWTPSAKGAEECGLGDDIHDDTKAAFVGLLDSNRDTNKHLKDIVFPSNNVVCNDLDKQEKGFEVFSEKTNTCWLNVHPDHYQVYDMTVWTVLHPGGGDKIKQFAERGEAFLVFPYSSYHGMQRWAANKEKFHNLGRLGDTTNFRDLPADLQISEISKAYSDVDLLNGVVVCGGTESEVANEPELGGTANLGAFDLLTHNNRTTNFHEHRRQREMVWTRVVLNSPDQLRQRVAWALSQLFAINDDTVGRHEHSEQFLGYYDIFVRHAMGNYRDIIREVSYSVPMAYMLSYFRSRSTAFEWHTAQGNLIFPDENFAREIMQLFTIGLYHLNEDGTKKSGNNTRTYSNEDVMEYARAWTGFLSQSPRGNVEYGYNENRVDPMQIIPEWRDRFPKMGLNRRYVGEGYPLCTDLPPRHFLKKGAKFRLLGYGLPEYNKQPHAWASSPDRLVRDVVAVASADSLYAKLCASADSSDLTKACTYPATVTLNENLLCHGKECGMSNIDVIRLPDGVQYEYVRQPCVNQAFYSDAKKVKQRMHWNGFMCADPRSEVASTSCCENGGNAAYLLEDAWGERMSYAVAEERCNTVPLRGDQTGMFCPENFYIRNWKRYQWQKVRFHWTANACTLKVKIGSDLRVAIVHSADDVEQSKLVDHVQEDSKTFFRVDWDSAEDAKVLLEGCDANPSCTISTDQYCVCTTETIETAVFEISSEELPSGMPTVDEVMKLRIGALEPDVYFGSSYDHAIANGVTVYYKGAVGADSIFEVVDSFGNRQLRRNLKSEVIVAGETSFRNPVHFISLVPGDSERRDAEHETEAVLDHYFYHPNVGPFLAYRFAQRFGVSNPSPRYVSVISAAFRTGIHLHEENGHQVSFGSGKYGDMKATIAAVLLDREARSMLLDVDPHHGAIKEPILKLTGLMRGLEFVPANDEPFPILFVNDKIGQMAHKLPSVFSFFLPEYRPDGVVSDSGLVAPEAELHSPPNVIATINGLTAFVKYGLDRCWGGFGNGKTGWTRCGFNIRGHYSSSSGILTYSPYDASSCSSQIDEISTILTSGRLSSESREILTNMCIDQANSTLALIETLTVAVSTPEFHTTGRVQKSGSPRPSLPIFPPSPRPYKAVVFLMLSGGFDSFNLFVPHGQCSLLNSRGQNAREQYQMERGKLAFTDAERNQIIDIGHGQPCQTWAIHPAMTIVPELWNNGELAWSLNTGVLNSASTNKVNYFDVTETQLFAHNAMQEESKRVDPFNAQLRTGVLGRAAKVLNERGFRSGAFSINFPSLAVNGGKGAPVQSTINNWGVKRFLPKSWRDSFDPTELIKHVNEANDESSSIFAETFSSILSRGVAETAQYDAMLKTTQNYQTQPRTPKEMDLGMVSKLMQTHPARGVDRDIFYVQNGDWDHHAELKKNVQPMFEGLNAQLRFFREELKHKGLWDKVTLVLVSDFGRTLTPNSNLGSDHAWGGNYFLMGGALNQGVVLGQYPEDLTDDGPLNIGRGRFIPTQAWESMWNPVLQWMGMEAPDLDFVLPNAVRTGTQLHNKDTLFKPGS